MVISNPFSKAAKQRKAQAVTHAAQGTIQYRNSLNGLDYCVIGSESQSVVFDLKPGQSVQAEAGSMIYMDDAIEMDVSLVESFIHGIGRLIGGEQFFMPSFVNRGDKVAQVGFSGMYPGEIMEVDLDQYGGTFYAESGAFLVAPPSVNIFFGFASVSAGFFAGEGFFLQKLTGSGKVLLNVSGSMIRKQLGPGEVLRVSIGNLVGFSGQVSYTARLVKGVLNWFLAGEGVFLAKLVGPGLVIMQTYDLTTIYPKLDKENVNEAKRKQALV